MVDWTTASRIAPFFPITYLCLSSAACHGFSPSRWWAPLHPVVVLYHCLRLFLWNSISPYFVHTPFCHLCHACFLAKHSRFCIRLISSSSSPGSSMCAFSTTKSGLEWGLAVHPCSFRHMSADGCSYFVRYLKWSQFWGWWNVRCLAPRVL